MTKPVYFLGSSHSQFSIQPEATLYSLFADAIEGAIGDAGLQSSEVDSVFVANYSGGSFNDQEHLAPYAVNVDPGLRLKPMFRAEGACASGSSAVHLAQMAIQSGQVDNAVVVGVEKMSSLDRSGVTRTLAKASLFPEEGANGYSFPGLFAEFANGWLAKYKQDPQRLRHWLATISAKAYAFGEQNPLAQLRKKRSVEEILGLPNEKNPVIAAPLRLHDCSPVSDGAAAVVLSCQPPAKDVVELANMNTGCDYLNIVNSRQPNFFFEAAQVGINKVLSENKKTLADIQFAEIHDCFTIAEFLMYSALGLTRHGREFEALESGKVLAGGGLVVNPSGGLKSKGHPVGATGVSMHALAYRQLCGRASGHQIEDAENALIVNLGGSASTNIVSLLSRIS